MPLKKNKLSATTKRASTIGSRRKRRSADDILNRIVRAATAEFKRRGYAGTTTATIARKADVTEAQLFRYFGSKANLFRETIFKPLDEHLLAFIGEQAAADVSAASTRERSNLYTTELQRFITAHAKMLTSLVVAQTYETGAAHGVGGINSLRTYFEHGAAIMAKEMTAAPKVDPKLMVRVSFVAVLACIMFKDWIFPAGLATEGEIRDAINTFVMEGIGANYDSV